MVINDIYNKNTFINHTELSHFLPNTIFAWLKILQNSRAYALAALTYVYRPSKFFKGGPSHPSLQQNGEGLGAKGYIGDS
jgi:hypothetical protein